MTDAIVPRAPRIRKAWLLAAAASFGIVVAAMLIINAPQPPERSKIAQPSSPFSPPGQSEWRKTHARQQQPSHDDAALSVQPQKAKPTNPFIRANVAAPNKTGPNKPKIARGSRPETGRASWYDLDTPTASGETIDDDDLTAAHPTLPLGTHVLVENLDNGQSVVVRINDRGPFIEDRIIDLSKAAATKIGMVGAGVATVRVSRVEAAFASDKSTTR